jgi:hypothetical protein
MKKTRSLVGLLMTQAAFGMVVAGALSASLPALAAERGCTEKRAVTAPRPAAPRPAVRSGHQTYLTAVRMGWAIS